MNFYERHLGVEWRDHPPGRWRTYDLMAKTPLPRFQGVYVVYVDGVMSYIGQSCDIANRFSEHKIRHGYAKVIRTPWGDFPVGTSLVIKVKRSKVLGDWAMWEIRLIHRLRPIFNSHHKGRKAKREQD